MLPGAIREVRFLQDHFSGEYLYKKAANEQAFKDAAPYFDIIHLAMHGLVDNQNPQFSSLVLDKDSLSEEDDILYAYEIQNLQLNPDLVVLSACETGVGKFQQGEGVLSIGRGFMYAGTSSLVMTLWGLNDYSGSEIIENYYQFLTKGMDKDEALKKAKLDYIQENSGLLSHPALWACYIQMGNTDPISIKPNLGDSKWKQYLGILIAGVFLSLGLRHYLQSSSNHT
jgi:CHAT domain-containing protein